MTDITIEVKGLEKVTAAIAKFPHEIAKYLNQAGDEAAKKAVLNTQGLQKYPPATDANRPPVPYYVRGKGMQYKSGNTGGSERFGTQWYVESEGYGTRIGNRTSYGIYVSGDYQPAHMATKGWRKLTDVVDEKMDKITKVYQAWVDKLIHDLGL